MNKTTILFIVMILLGAGLWWRTWELGLIKDEIAGLRVENAYLTGRVQELRKQRDGLAQRMQDWLDEWDVGMAEVSAYAPTDPRAVRGWDFSGDPAVTASGAKTIPGVTVAAGPEVPFGTNIYVVGAGHRVVQDRGGRIGADKFDLVVPTQEEAFAWGRRMVKTVWQQRPGGHEQ